MSDINYYCEQCDLKCGSLLELSQHRRSREHQRKRLHSTSDQLLESLSKMVRKNSDDGPKKVQ